MNGWIIAVAALGVLCGMCDGAKNVTHPDNGNHGNKHSTPTTTSSIPQTTKAMSTHAAVTSGSVVSNTRLIGKTPTKTVITSGTGSTATHSTTTPLPTTSTTTTPDPRINKTVCYDAVGCFDNYPPFNNAALDLPVSPEVLQTGFWLYTRANNDFDMQDELNYTDPMSVKNSLFDPKKLTKFVIHGFNNHGNTSWVQELRHRLLLKGDFNVIVVDWGRGASFPDYGQAVANTRLVGTQVKLLVELMMAEGLHLEDLHLLGHSLGAHTSGYTGRLLGGKITRISGFDPAEPNFEDEPLIVRLDKSDAQFVDVTHTNGGGFGVIIPSGHVDFYLNGGENQPGCPKGIISGALGSLFGPGDISKAVGCSHGRSYDVYMESLFTSCPFTAYPCSSYKEFQRGHCLTCGTQGCTQFGYYSDQYHARGKFYLNTAAKTPFCGYHYGIDMSAPSGVTETKGKLLINLIGEWGTTGFIPLTGDDTLSPGARIVKVVIAPKEVGDITAVEVKYVKHSGFWFGSGEDSFALDRVQLTSGENGSKYLVCLGGRILSHNTALKVSVATSRTC